jgi:hypothetical protein
MAATVFLRWTAFLSFLACVAVFATGFRSVELAFFALALFIIVALTCGMGEIFTRRFWVGTPQEEAVCARVDAELEAIEEMYR